MKHNFLDDIETVIEGFVAEADNIVAFANLEKDLFPLINNDKEAKFKELFGVTKTAHYNGIVISFYGLYERIFKELTKIYIKFSLKTDLLSALKIKTKHAISVLKLFGNNNIESQKDVVSKLYKFFVEDKIEYFNYDYALGSFQNLKIDEIRSILNIVGISYSNKDFLSDEYYLIIKDFYGYNSLEDAKLAISRRTNAFSEIDDFVERRNAIAHKGHDDNPVSLDYLVNCYIKTIKQFIINYSKLVKIQFVISKIGGYERITLTDDIYNSKIITFNTGPNIITKQDTLILVLKNENPKIATIVSLRNDDKNEINSSEQNENISCELSCRIRNNNKLYIIDKLLFLYDE